MTVIMIIMKTTAYILRYHKISVQKIKKSHILITVGKGSIIIKLNTENIFMIQAVDFLLFCFKL